MKQKFVLIVTVLFMFTGMVTYHSFATEKYTLELLTQPKFINWGKWSDNLLWLSGNNDFLYLDKNGDTHLDVMVIAEKKNLEILGEKEYNSDYPNGMPTNHVSAYDFNSGLALLRIARQGYYVDTNGKIIAESKDSRFPVSEGYILYSGLHDTEEYITDLNGNRKLYGWDGKTPNQWSIYVNEVHEGLVVYSDYSNQLGDFFHPRNKGYRDLLANIVIEAQFDDARPFNQELAFVKMDDKWGIIDKSGNYIASPQFDSFKKASRSGNFVPRDFLNIGPIKVRDDYTVFHDGLAAVGKNIRWIQTGPKSEYVDRKWGYVNKSGDLIVDYIYDDCSLFHENRAFVKKDGKWAIIDTAGKLLTDFEFDSAYRYMNGLAVVMQNHKFGYVDLQGNIVIEPKFDDAKYFYDGVALVKDGMLYRMINEKGDFVSDVVWPFTDVQIDPDSPEMMMYKYNDEWGLAKYVLANENDPSFDSSKWLPLIKPYDSIKFTPEGKGRTIYSIDVNMDTTFIDGDLFIRKNGERILLKAGPSGVVGEGQGINLWEDFISPDDSKLEHGETSPIDEFYGETFMTDKYGEGHHNSEWRDIGFSEIRRANEYVKNIKANGGSVQKGETYGKWLIYDVVGWSWTVPVNQ